MAHYNVVCKKWDFEKIGSNQGIHLTLDGSDDDLIEFRGVDGFWFSEEDAGDFDPGPSATWKRTASPILTPTLR